MLLEEPPKSAVVLATISRTVTALNVWRALQTTFHLQEQPQLALRVLVGCSVMLMHLHAEAAQQHKPAQPTKRAIALAAHPMCAVELESTFLVAAQRVSRALLDFSQWMDPRINVILVLLANTVLQEAARVQIAL